MTFSEYYNGQFAADLSLVMSQGFRAHEFDEVTVQPRTVSSENPVVVQWPKERQAVFAAALFLTVLVDQVCYTHFRSNYDKFRGLTQYPKFRGDCPGGCYSHINPGVVFRAIGRDPGPVRQYDSFPYDRLPADTLETMRREVNDFVDRHMPELGEKFWQLCKMEIPRGLTQRSSATEGPQRPQPGRSI